jgi:hypothetical protein
MISVNCSQCRATLEMDDAFAGGVCRCHYCGTIQTVPSNAKHTAQAVASPAMSAQQQAPRATAAAGTAAGRDGLNALADAVAGSGLGRGGLQSPAAATTQPVDYARPPRQKSRLVPLVIGLTVVVLFLCAALGFLMLGSTVVTPGPGGGGPVVPAPGGTSGGNTVGPGGQAEVVVPKDPHFLGIDLTKTPSVVYVLDRGNATAELFDTLKEATYRSLETLKPGQKFQVIFWEKADDQVAYPADGLVEVSQQEIDTAREQFADVIAAGRASPDGAVSRAAKHKPAAIVLVTGKAFDMEEELVAKVQKAVAGSTTKVHTVALRGDDGNTVLKDIAKKTNGEYRVVTAPELRQYSY